MKKLEISEDLHLSKESATQTFGILAQRRKGKTYTATVMAEEMVDTGIPWVALDPTGAWWGLRSSADGKSPGLPVYVFGGDHGDLPLERNAGAMIADLVIKHPGWYVLDFSHFESKAAEREFATDFAERFYRRKGTDKRPMHLFVDEADMFAPQQAPAGDKRMLGAFESIVRRGGIRGIGTTLITQRAAVLNKNVLEQIDVLIALRTVGPNDRKAIAGYVEAYASPEQQAQLMGSIASLELGEAWIWEPGADLFKRVHIRKRRTYNSSATPKVGEESVPITALAKVDLDKLRDKMASAIEAATADDPKALREQIGRLKQELFELQGQKPQVEMHQVEVLPDKLVRIIDGLVEVTTDAANRAIALRVYCRKFAPSDGSMLTAAEAKSPITIKPPSRSEVHRPLATQPDRYSLSKAERSILSVLRQYHPDTRNAKQIGLIAGYSPKSGGFNNALSQLRKKGLMSGYGDLAITEAGVEAIGNEFVYLPKGHALLEYWVTELGKCEGLILRTLYDSYPASMTAAEVAEMTGYSRGSGGFNNALSKLRKLQLISGYGDLTIDKVFFEDAPDHGGLG